MVFCTTFQPNCTSLDDNPWLFEADPDIAGKGVVGAFIATSLLAVLLGLFHSILTLSYEDDIYIIDEAIAVLSRRFFAQRVALENRLRCKRIIERILFTLVNQQLVLGLAFAIAGLWRRCSISAYHFQIIADLVWFSAVALAASLSSLDLYFQEHHVGRSGRVCLIILTGVMMITMVVLTSHDQWYEYYSSDAQCLFNTLTGNVHGSNLKWAVALCIIYGTDYTVSIINLYKPSSKAFQQYIVQKPERRLKRNMDELVDRRQSGNFGLDLVKCLILLPLYLLMFALHQLVVWILDSYVGQFLVNVFWLYWGFYGFLTDRAVAQGHMKDGEDENEMGVGQLVPIFVLLSTLFVFQEAAVSEFRSKIWKDKAFLIELRKKEKENAKQQRGKLSSSTVRRAETFPSVALQRLNLLSKDVQGRLWWAWGSPGPRKSLAIETQRKEE